jgi:cytochrome bd-type quinol oxidase subunit 1
MWASVKGHLDVVRTLLKGNAAVNAQNMVRNLMMMIMMIMILLTILMLMMMMMMMMMIVVNDEDRDVVDNDNRRSMYLC